MKAARIRLVDLACITDPRARLEAFQDLNRMIELGYVQVYQSPTGHTWNIWFHQTRERVELADWAQRRAA